MPWEPDDDAGFSSYGGGYGDARPSPLPDDATRRQRVCRWFLLRSRETTTAKALVVAIGGLVASIAGIKFAPNLLDSIGVLWALVAGGVMAAHSETPKHGGTIALPSTTGRTEVQPEDDRPWRRSIPVPRNGDLRRSPAQPSLDSGSCPVCGRGGPEPVRGGPSSGAGQPPGFCCSPGDPCICG